MPYGVDFYTQDSVMMPYGAGFFAFFASCFDKQQSCACLHTEMDERRFVWPLYTLRLVHRLDYASGAAGLPSLAQSALSAALGPDAPHW